MPRMRNTSPVSIVRKIAVWFFQSVGYGHRLATAATLAKAWMWRQKFTYRAMLNDWAVGPTGRQSEMPIRILVHNKKPSLA